MQKSGKFRPEMTALWEVENVKSRTEREASLCR